MEQNALPKGKALSDRPREGMSLKTAKAIARKVGARITEHGSVEASFLVVLAIPEVGKNGQPARFWAQSPREAAHTAIIETAKACQALLVEAKQIYVDENLLF